MRWMYLLLGLGGAVVFYTGNLLWIESRRKKQRDASPPGQKRSTRVLGSLTIGVSLGCVIGVSATLAATKWLPGLVANVPAWHEGIYYVAFLLAVAWAFLRGAARSAYELLYVGAVVTALIPVGSLAALAGVPCTLNHSSMGGLGRDRICRCCHSLATGEAIQEARKGRPQGQRLGHRREFSLGQGAIK
ncbi:TPA: hypothetical protein ACOEQV_000099 [Stenotrophomonas maltophilia]